MDIKKIAIVRGSGTVINIESYNCQEVGLAKALLKVYDISVDVYLCSKEERVFEVAKSEKSKVRIFFKPFYSFPGQQAYIKGLRQNLIGEGYDLIQVHEYHFFISGLIGLWGRQVNIPVVLCQGLNKDFSGVFIKLFQKLYDRTFWPYFRRRFSGFCVKTEAARDYLQIQKGLKGIIHITPIGLDLDKFNRPLLKDWRGEFSVPFNSKLVVNIGNFNPNKGGKFLLKVFAEICKKLPNSYFLWVGQITDEEYFQECMNLAEQWKIKDRVLFPGVFKQAYLPSLYEQADLFLYSTMTGIYGMVFLEAMYFGLPVVTNLAGGSQQIIENGKTGILLSEDDVHEWADTVSGLLLDGNRLDMLKEAAKVSIRSHFIWEAAVENFYNCYSHCLSSENCRREG